MNRALEEIGLVADAELVRRVELLVKSDRAVTAKLLVHLGEMQARRLYAGLGYSSMYSYCQSALRMSDDEAYLRLKAAEVCRRFPLVLERLAAGAVNLTGIKLLAKRLTDENHAQLLERIQQKSKREIEILSAELEPKPDVPARVRKLPAQRVVTSEPLLAVAQTSAEVAPPPAAAPSAPLVLESPRPRASSTPLSPGRFKLEVTLGQEAQSKLEQLRELLRHQNPSGDLALIVERALSELLEREMKRRFAQVDKPQREAARSGTAAREDAPRRSRYIPRAVLRAVFARDGGQCTFVSSDGRRCAERGFLEMHHHEVTFARAGAHTADNLRLACRAHNLFFAEKDYGRKFMQRKLLDAADRASRSGPASPVIACGPLFSALADRQANACATR